MCTAVSWCADRHFFGRTLDYERSYGEGVAVTPRNYPFKFRHNETVQQHYAMIGMATVRDGYPLYYDAMNEKGLCIAGLLFAGNAVYQQPRGGADNVASFEIIPWLLTGCANIGEVKERISSVRITDTPFSDALPPTPLHWLIADKSGCLVVEPLKNGVTLYENPIGVLTNNPPFDYHLLHLTEFLQVSSTPPVNNLYSSAPLHPYSRGMGGIGLPGDYSSASRFVRAAFVKGHAVAENTAEGNISQFFHILQAVEMPKGCVLLEDGSKAFSIYTSCCDAQGGIYRYYGYEKQKMTAVDMYKENLTADAPVWYPFGTGNI